jgi:hypothetical protein
MSFTATQVLSDAMLVGGIDGALDDDPTNHAYAILFDGSAVALVTMVFAKPAATLIAHALVFAQDDLSGDFILTQGNAATFELYSGAGVLLGTGDVSDMAGTGALKVSGTTGTLLFAGARAVLGELKFV